ncbi:alpha/beta fold hydrolase [Nonomuraea jiangxiensis]|uniref:Pimeloyl-ACP methyl ester carboxylesterase n=1 Tax=Nonomuraea jiangxiensis TaxID=633440 RepID=A0A1G8Q777_9ACTN|nr:alpha/beta hydrolase [Nonomuraea jiangxiensis]SDJ00587.1 Pimeloyl-ACP methyl ester carboxylesterase [Nonomuraea jiangxiensis]
MKRAAKTRHLYRELDGVKVHYREAGVPSSTAVLLLHGFPSSSYSFRDVLPALGEHVYAIAPDLPGFGFSDAPPLDEYEYTFERLSHVIEALLDDLGVERYVLFVTDFGTPVGYRMAMRHPERVLGLVVQNGNTHEAGLHEGWDAPRRFWAEPSEENRAALPDWLNFSGTRDQYLSGLRQELRDLHPRESWHLDWERLSLPGNLDIQFQLFYDYRNHVARFPEIAAYHKEHQPPCLVLWGRHDTFYDIAEVLAYHQDMTTLDAHLYDAGHFLLETHAAEVAAALVTFLDDVLDRSGARS